MIFPALPSRTAMTAGSSSPAPASRRTCWPWQSSGVVLGLRHAEVLFQRLKSSADYAEFAEDTVCSSAPVGAAYSPFESTNDQTIGVMLDREQSVQAFSSELPDSLFPDFHFKAGGGTLGEALVFLILRDLWNDHAEVRQAYREVSNRALPQFAHRQPGPPVLSGRKCECGRRVDSDLPPAFRSREPLLPRRHRRGQSDRAATRQLYL